MSAQRSSAKDSMSQYCRSVIGPQRPTECQIWSVPVAHASSTPESWFPYGQSRLTSVEVQYLQIRAVLVGLGAVAVIYPDVQCSRRVCVMPTLYH